MEYLRKLIKIFKLFIIFFLISCLLTGNVYAEEIKPEILPEEPLKCEKPDVCGEIIFDPTVEEIPISLAEAVSIVLDKNFDVKIFVQRKLRDKWRYYQTITNWFPDLGYQFRIAKIQGTFLVDFVLPDSVSEIPIESNFLLNYNLNINNYFALKEAFYNFNSAKKELEFTKDEALLEASRRYYDLLRAKLTIEIHKRHVQQIEEQFRINKQRVEAGTGTQFDVLRAEADRNNAIHELLDRQNAYRLAQAQLANLLGIPVFIQLVPNEKDVFLKDIFCDCFELEKACKIAIYNRDDLAASRFDIEAARQRKNSGYSVYFPTINIRGQLASQGTADTGLFPSERIELFAQWNGLAGLGLRGYTEVKARKAELQEQELLYITRSRDIQENLVRTFSSTVTARKLIEPTFKELEAARVSRELSLIRLQEEIGSFIDVIQTQGVYTLARLHSLDVLIDYNISQIELLFEMGAISPENILYGFSSGALKPNTNNEKTKEYNKKIMEELERLKKDEEAANQQRQGTLRQLPGEDGIFRDQEPGPGSDSVGQGESERGSDNQSGQSGQVGD